MRAHRERSQRRGTDEDGAGLDSADGHVLQEFSDEGDQHREQERGKMEPVALYLYAESGRRSLMIGRRPAATDVIELDEIRRARDGEARARAVLL